MKISNLNFEDIELISNSGNVQEGIIKGRCFDCQRPIKTYQLMVTKNLEFAWWNCKCLGVYRKNTKFLVENSEQVYFTLKLFIK